MTDVEEEVESFLEAYATEFSTADPEVVASHFAIPALVVAEEGNRSLADREAIESLFGAVFNDLRSRDYGHSELVDVDVHPVGGNRALAAVHWTRRTIDGDVLEELGTTHLLRREDGDWKMTVLVPGTPDDLPVPL
jgi:ketosteroid isomerase-like protein